MRGKWPVIVLDLVILMLGLGLAEAANRFLHPEATREGLRERLGCENRWARPDAEFHHVGDGIFELKFPSKTATSNKRVLIVGDSNTMGHGVGKEYRFGELLQRHLQPEMTVDVLATSSYSPVIYRNIVRKALSLARYDAVAVFVDQTDPADDLIYQEDLEGKASSNLFDVSSMRERSRLIDQVCARMLEELSGPVNLRRLATFNILKPFPLSLTSAFASDNRHHRYIHFSLDRVPLIAQFGVGLNGEMTRKMESLIFRHLDEIAALCRAHRVPLLLTANPWEYQTSKNPRVALSIPGPYPRPNRLEQLIRDRYGRRGGVYVIPMTQAFLAHRDPSSLFLDRPATEIHWNRDGHRLVEQVLRAFLLARMRLWANAGGHSSDTAAIAAGRPLADGTPQSRHAHHASMRGRL